MGKDSRYPVPTGRKTNGIIPAAVTIDRMPRIGYIRPNDIGPRWSSDTASLERAVEASVGRATPEQTVGRAMTHFLFFISNCGIWSEDCTRTAQGHSWDPLRTVIGPPSETGDTETCPRRSLGIRWSPHRPPPPHLPPCPMGSRKVPWGPGNLNPGINLFLILSSINN